MSELPLAAPGQKTGYRVQLAVFQGPLDLLLRLIERDELDITRVSLARVTDQYLEYLKALEELQVQDLSDFVVVAARLLLIKSQALLPRQPAQAALDEDDPGEQLLRQLRAYKQFKEIAKQLEARQKSGRRSFVRLAAQPHLEAGIQHLEPVSLEMLLVAARRALQARPSAPTVDHIVSGFSLTINEQIDHINTILSKQSHVRFVQLLTDSYSRQEVAVTFLAVLELIKQYEIQAHQERMFGEIIVEPLNHAG
jgi:segregation and condensation protein A